MRARAAVCGMPSGHRQKCITAMAGCDDPHALAPGSTLDQEALARQLGLSTTPVREALRWLESERLVVSRAHRNTLVASLSLDLLEEVYAIRLVVEAAAAEHRQIVDALLARQVGRAGQLMKALLTVSLESIRRLSADFPGPAGSSQS